jgi:hypothetical protein
MKRKAFAIFFVVLFTLAASGQRRRHDRFPPFPPAGECMPGDRLCEEQKHTREKALNKQRQEELKRDTDKLYQLATELKAAVDKTNENTLSVEVIKKTDEIEKLAKEVRKKMKNE